MNSNAEKHLAKAKDYIAKGDEFYRQAKPEIDAAKAEGARVQEICRSLQKSEAWVYDILAWDGEGTLYGKDSARRQSDRAKQTLREKPEIIHDLEPAEQRRLATELDNAAAKRQKDRERISASKEREAVGDDTVDDLELREELQSTEYLLITARGNLRGFVKRTGEIGVDNTPEAWRQSCRDWIEDLKGHLGMAEALLAGGDIDWSAFDELLEVN